MFVSHFIKLKRRFWSGITYTSFYKKVVFFNIRFKLQEINWINWPVVGLVKRFKGFQKTFVSFFILVSSVYENPSTNLDKINRIIKKNSIVNSLKIRFKNFARITCACYVSTDVSYFLYNYFNEYANLFSTVFILFFLIPRSW